MKTTERAIPTEKIAEVTTNKSNTRARFNPTNGASASPENLHQRIADTLRASTTMLVDQFIREWSVEIERIDERKDELRIVLRLGFETPSPTSDWLISAREVTAIRRGFCSFLKKGLERRRMTNLFYEQFVDFIFEYKKMHRLPPEILRRIKPIGERRLSGRAPLLIPADQIADAKKQLFEIRSFVYDMQATVNKWKKRNPKITDEIVLERLRSHYDKNQSPWIICLPSLPMILPAKRSQSELTSTISCPDRWEVVDFAVRLAQQWLLRDSGKRYDLKQIKRLIRSI
jgi:hypothetical protein